MISNAVAGSLGLVLQIVVFLLVLVLSARRYGVSAGLVHGGVVAVYGYSLIISFSSLLTVPWQVTNVILAAAVGVSLLLRSTRQAISGGIAPLLDAARRGWAFIVVVASVATMQLLVAGIDPELSIDGQLYHGPTLANIVQSGSLWNWAVPNQYLYYTDLTMAGGVNLATFTGVARFDNALQVPHLLLLIFIVNWALSRRFSSASLRVCLATLMVVSPVIWLQPRILYVDVAYATAVVGAIFAVTLTREFRKLEVLVAGVLVAAVFATKPTGILTGSILLLALVVVVIIRRRALNTGKSTLCVLLLGVGIPLLAAMSFYLRNLIQFGNPIYPIQAKLGPILFPGILDVSIFASGDRGSGFVDPSRLPSYFGSIGFGMIHGVTKLDYDPRVGGFGYVPLAVLMVAVALIGVQVLVYIRGRSTNTIMKTGQSTWKSQLAIVLLAGAILSVQPSTFDSRYVMAPTIALLIAVLLTGVFAVPTVIQIIAGVVTLLLAASQLYWTERHMFAGIVSSEYIAALPSTDQPVTPGNPWKRSTSIDWLSTDPARCYSIGVETAGGLTPSGMSETSFLGTLPYGLYGDQLCNRVFPIVLQAGGGDPSKLAKIKKANYLIVYSKNEHYWLERLSKSAACFTQVATVPGNPGFPQGDYVLRNSCP